MLLIVLRLIETETKMSKEIFSGYTEPFPNSPREIRRATLACENDHQGVIPADLDRSIIRNIRYRAIQIRAVWRELSHVKNNTAKNISKNNT